MKNSVSKLIPALLGGTVIGALSSIPIISMGNCVCCMWVLLGSVVGVYAYNRQLPPRSDLTSSEGALVGLLCGVFGALIGTLFNVMVMAAFGTTMGSFLEFFQDRMDDMPPEWVEWMENMAGSPVLVLIGLFFNTVTYSVFGIMGGLVGAALFGKRKPRKTKV